jgi:hypothetical protein
MSYALAGALQAAVFAQLRGDATVAGLVGDAVFDAAPPGALPALYVSLGPEIVRDRSDKSGAGAEHEFIVSVVSDAAGFAGAKAVAGAISDALVGAELVLARGRLVGLWFLRARAQRVGGGERRRIDLTFRARVEDV